MTTTTTIKQEKKSMLLINTLSVIIPLAVVVLLSLPKVDLGSWTKSLSHVIGFINTVTTAALVAGFVFIKQKKIGLHRIAMTISFALGALFLVCYVLYHLTNPANVFNATGAVRYIYLFILFTHILLSLVVLPLVLRAMFYAVTKQFDLHKRLVKYAYPIWLYVSATGVAVYLMLYHLYPAK